MDIKTDSRKVLMGDIFVALKGINKDGHDFVKEAIKNGATKIIAEYGSYDVETLLVKDTRKYLIDYLKCNYYSLIKDIKLIGITGTNGKTTTSYLIYQALNMANIKCAYIGTIGFYMEKKVMSLNNTTPDILELYEMLINCHKEDYNYVVMEVSSQALAMNRLDTLLFDYAIFTNLTQDHLDYHKSMDNYVLAKQKLFKMLKSNSKTIVNIDDMYKDYFINDKTITYGFSDSIYHVTNYKLELNKIIFEINNELFETKLIGKYNIYNLLVCIIILKELKIGNIKEIVKELECPVGRMMKVMYKDNVIIVDYAHTPDALEKIITNMRDLNINYVYTIIGCGGNRDITKRPIMGNIATTLSDYVIFTNDNPRNENPNHIIKDIVRNIPNNNYKIIKNRYKAIKKGIQLLSKNDILLVLGKGHENYQIKKNKKRYFSDIETILKIIRR